MEAIISHVTSFALVAAACSICLVVLEALAPAPEEQKSYGGAAITGALIAAVLCLFYAVFSALLWVINGIISLFGG
jgi:hypothetical protein